MSEKEFNKKEIKEIDKVILIGNGFDRSLGVPTLYTEFLVYLFKKHLLISVQNGEDHIASPTASKKYNYFVSEFFTTSFNKELFSKPFKKEEFEQYLSVQNDLQELLIYLNRLQFNYNKNSEFVKRLYQNGITGWGNVEQVYYDMLIEMEKKGMGEDEKNSKVKELNNQLDYLKKELIVYLKTFTLNKSEIDNYALKLKSALSRGVINYDFGLDDDSAIKLVVSNHLFINFNYTDFLNKILNSSTFNSYRRKPKVIPIHGYLEKEDGVIFGYGDEDTEGFNLLKNQKDNNLLSNIKTFNYLGNDTYRRFLVEIDKAKYFQLIIIGHSCSLSDRVLLKEIMENKKCKSIRIIYYNKDDYYSKVYNISRIITNNRDVRKKVLSFDECEEIQHSDILNQ